MQKTIVIDGKDIQLKVTGATPIRYGAEFGKDYFADVLKLGALEELADIQNMDYTKLDRLDTGVLYNVIYIFAKEADPNISEQFTWLASFDEFPVFDIVAEVQELLVKTMSTRKK
ncbi:hypothetical protein [Bacillus thuringiensis]|uniref:Prophage pi2 protein 40 n=1 Tax=Bacillus thuringiensis TaxID=1428 RepID=A0A9X6TI43_BACTU|nr:hypothetical protein [Bacillus thuringiensis]PEA86640.1 hypothetical protein CON71_28760 [Bacillus thuringiensis]